MTYTCRSLERIMHCDGRSLVRRALSTAVAVVLAGGVAAYGQRLPVQTFTDTDGLANDRVKCIVPDSRGFLWFCSAGGLDWFDGRRFTGHALEEGLGYSTNDILESSDRTYWIATNGRGVARFDPAGRHVAVWPPDSGAASGSRLQWYAVGDSAATNRVNKVFRDSSGTLWAGTDSGLFRLDASGTFEAVPLASAIKRHIAVWCFAETSDRRLWIGTSAGLFYRGQDGHVRQEVLPGAATPPSVLALLAEGQTLWIGAEGLYRRAAGGASEAGPARFLVPGVDDTRRVLALHKTPAGAILIAHASGPIVRYNANRSFEFLTTAHGLPQPSSNVLASDAEGNLWVSMGVGYGVARVLKRGFTTYGRNEGLADDVINVLVETKDGSVCAAGGTDAAPALQCFDGQRFVVVRPALPPGAIGWQRWRRTLHAGDGSWWFATRQGTFRFPAVTRFADLARATPQRVRPAAGTAADDGALGIFEDSRGDIWEWHASAGGYGMARWQRGADRFVPVEGLPAVKQVYDIVDDRAGNLWIGFRDGGVGRLSQGRFELWGTDAGVPNVWAQVLYRDGRGRLWIGTAGGGVLRVDEPTAERPVFALYTTAQGLSFGASSAFVEDRWGGVYISTGVGIDRLDVDRNWIEHYNGRDGLVAREVRVALADRTGRLWFGTAKGLARFVPEQLEPPDAPAVRIQTFRIGGVPYPLSLLGELDVPDVRIPVGYTPIDIEYAAAAANVRYQYRLEGAHDDWRRPARDGSITLANLPAGTYRFAVRAVRHGGEVVGRPATVAFTILPPVWQRGWFQAAAAVLLAAIAYALYRYRVGRLLEVERLRTRIATDLHDDIGSSLSRIAIMSEVAARRGAQPGGETAGELESIGQTARELVDSMSDIVWAINPRHDALMDLTGRMRRFAADLLTPNQIAFSFQAPPDDGAVHLSPDLRREVFLTFKEALHNIVRHSQCSQASIELRIAHGMLELSISDNGVGFSRDRVQYGHGLANLTARAQRLEGAFDVWSEPGRGTSLTLLLPMRAGRMTHAPTGQAAR